MSRHEKQSFSLGSLKTRTTAEGSGQFQNAVTKNPVLTNNAVGREATRQIIKVFNLNAFPEEIEQNIIMILLDISRSSLRDRVSSPR